jgi:hypothetical protein
MMIIIEIYNGGAGNDNIKIIRWFWKQISVFKIFHEI